MFVFETMAVPEIICRHFSIFFFPLLFILYSLAEGGGIRYFSYSLFRKCMINLQSYFISQIVEFFQPKFCVRLWYIVAAL
jgi:hypothetical protein